MQFNDGKELASIWDYDPPGDLAGSGAWTVLRELATTLGRHGTGSLLTAHPVTGAKCAFGCIQRKAHESILQNYMLAVAALCQSAMRA